MSVNGLLEVMRRCDKKRNAEDELNTEQAQRVKKRGFYIGSQVRMKMRASEGMDRRFHDK